MLRRYCFIGALPFFNGGPKKSALRERRTWAVRPTSDVGRVLRPGSLSPSIRTGSRRIDRGRVRDANSGVDCPAAAARGKHQEGIQVELRYLGDVLGEGRDAQEDLAQRIEVGDRASAKTGQQR